MKKQLVGLLSVMVLLGCQEAKKEVQDETSPIVEEIEDAKNEIDYASLGIETSDIPEGLNVGDMIPDLSFTNANNQLEAFKTYYEKQPIVVIFYRGYWCPICNQHLSEFAEKAKDIETAGAKLIAISPESYENVAKTKEQTSADFTIISDLDGNIAKAFDVTFEVTNDYQAMILDKLNASIIETNANKKGELPIPATFIIDKTGKIVYRQFDPDYKNRASVEEILKNLPQ